MQRILDSLLAVDKPAGQANVVSADAEPCAEFAAPMECASASCTSDGCKRKRTKECAVGMCFQCCYNLKTTNCAAHFRMRKKREEEDRFIEEGMRATSRQKTTFYHYESKFMKCDQTVVIWCLQDFLRRKEWSGDTMAQYRREQRTQELFRRRQSQNSELQSQSSSSSLAVDRKGLSSPSASQASASPAKRGRGKPPAAVKAVGGSDGKSGGTGKKTVSMASTGASGRPLSRRARRFDKVKAMWESKYKLKSRDESRCRMF